jgi:trehalose 6-phosphate phosphatase
MAGTGPTPVEGQAREPTDRAWLAQALEPVRLEPAASAVLLDIDGTLAPIAARPGEASVPEATAARLRELASLYGLVACVSGRRAVEARALVGVAELVYAGNHGLELLAPGADEPVLDPALGDAADAAAAFTRGLDPTRLEAVGLRREDKGPIQALHWRGVASPAAAELEAREIAAAAQASGLAPHWGRMVLELRPAVAVNKGSAVAGLLARHGARRALYGGDDVTDLDAFAALRRLRDSGGLEAAVCVAVASEEGPRELAERADVVVAGTDGFAAVLAAL